jgi:hypothetical protein
MKMTQKVLKMMIAVVALVMKRKQKKKWMKI